MVERARRQMAESGIDAMETLSPNIRKVAHTAMAVSHKTYENAIWPLNNNMMSVLLVPTRHSEKFSLHP